MTTNPPCNVCGRPTFAVFQVHNRKTHACAGPPKLKALRKARTRPKEFR